MPRVGERDLSADAREGNDWGAWDKHLDTDCILRHRSISCIAEVASAYGDEDARFSTGARRE